MVKVGVVGATGYTGEEIIECLSRNKSVEITSLAALVDKPDKFSNMFPRFKGKVDMVCKDLDVDEVTNACDVVFLALPHTVSMKYAPVFLGQGKKVIDLSADYRLPANIYRKWYDTEHSDKEHIDSAVYGLPELNRDKIAGAGLISNPGCYPTSVILALLPLSKQLSGKGLDVIVDSKSGATGAGRKAAVALCFGEVDENLKCYKANQHQHMPEMSYILGKAAGGDVKINFTPHLLPIRRGIMSTIYIKDEGFGSVEEVHSVIAEYYEKEYFVRVRPAGELPQILDVVGTNFCDIGVTVAGGLVVVVSVIDNLLKGASGQAVQNMNIMFGIDEKEGLV